MKAIPVFLFNTMMLNSQVLECQHGVFKIFVMYYKGEIIGFPDNDKNDTFLDLLNDFMRYKYSD